jgi:hypothetical protein
MLWNTSPHRVSYVRISFITGRLATTAGMLLAAVLARASKSLSTESQIQHQGGHEFQAIAGIAHDEAQANGQCSCVRQLLRLDRCTPSKALQQAIQA